MSNIKLEVKNDKFQILTFQGPDVLAPSDLVGLALPKNIDHKQGIVISGRGPIWLFGYLIHECHSFAWVATHDPRLGAVVVESHTPDIKPGDILEM